jgi:hypothetical protein
MDRGRMVPWWVGAAEVLPHFSTRRLKEHPEASTSPCESSMVQGLHCYCSYVPGEVYF